jgi:hypothetical protein
MASAAQVRILPLSQHFFFDPGALLTDQSRAWRGILCQFFSLVHLSLFRPATGQLGIFKPTLGSMSRKAVNWHLEISLG